LHSGQCSQSTYGHTARIRPPMHADNPQVPRCSARPRTGQQVAHGTGHPFSSALRARETMGPMVRTRFRGVRPAQGCASGSTPVRGRIGPDSCLYCAVMCGQLPCPRSHRGRVVRTPTPIRTGRTPSTRSALSRTPSGADPPPNARALRASSGGSVARWRAHYRGGCPVVPVRHPAARGYVRADPLRGSAATLAAVAPGPSGPPARGPADSGRSLCAGGYPLTPRPCIRANGGCGRGGTPVLRIPPSWGP
jgi:hypothetical protein